MADKPKAKSLRERIADRRRAIDAASGFGPTPKPKPKKKIDKADGTNEFLNRKNQENLR